MIINARTYINILYVCRSYDTICTSRQHTQIVDVFLVDFYRLAFRHMELTRHSVRLRDSTDNSLYLQNVGNGIISGLLYYIWRAKSLNSQKKNMPMHDEYKANDDDNVSIV